MLMADKEAARGCSGKRKTEVEFLGHKVEVEAADAYQCWQLALGAWLKTELIKCNSDFPRLPYEDLVLPPASSDKGEQMQVLAWVWGGGVSQT